MYIDLFIIFSYLFFVLFIAIYNSKNKSKFDNFTSTNIVDSKYGKFILISTIFASSIGGGTTFGLTEKIVSTNISYSIALIIAIITDLLIAKFIVKRLVIKHFGSKSVGDIFYSYYSSVGRYISSVAAILFSIGLFAAQINVSAKIFQVIANIDYFYAVVFSYCFIIIYTTIGGIESIFYANQLQFCFIIISIPIISIFGFYEIGFNNFINNIAYEKINFTYYDVIALSLNFLVINLFPTFIQRAIITKDYIKTSKSIYIKSIIYFFFIILLSINAIIVFMLSGDVPSSLALPVLIDKIIPHGLQAIVIIGLLSAAMSTADSDLNICSISIVNDFLKPIFNIDNQQKLLFIARFVNVFLGILAIFIALKFDVIVDLVIFVSGFWAPIIVVPLIMGLFNKIITQYQFLFIIIIVIFSFVMLELFLPRYFLLRGVFIATVIHLFLFICCFYYNKFINK